MKSIATAKFCCLVPRDDGKRGQLPCCCPAAANVLHAPIQGELDVCFLR